MQRFLHIFWFTLLILFQFFSGFTQHPPVIHLTDEDGLPSMVIYDIIQDSRGFLWLGTPGGLVRYDGQEFRIYTHPEATGKSISGLREDPAGRIWCQNFTNQIFYVENDSIQIFSGWNSPFENHYPSYEIDGEGNLWITSKDRLIRFDVSGREIHPMPTPDFSNTPIHLHILLAGTTSGDILFLSTKAYLVQNGKIIPVSYDSMSVEDREYYPQASKRAYGIGDELLFSYWYENKLFYIEDATIKPHPLTPLLLDRNSIQTRITKDNYDNYLIGTYSGALIADRQGKTLHSERFLFSGKNISKIIMDHEGNYWFATLSDGLYMIPSLELSVFTTSNSKIPDNQVTKLSAGQNHMLSVGFGDQSVGILNTNTLDFKFFKSPENNKAIETIVHHPTRPLVYFTGFGLYELDYQHKRTRTIRSPLVGKNLRFSNNNYLLVAAWGKPFLYNREMRETTNLSEISKSYLPESSFRPITAFDFIHNPITDKIYIAYKDGLFEYIPRVAEPVSVTDGDSSIIYTQKLHVASDGTLWIGSARTGLYRMQPNGQLSNENPGGNSEFFAIISKIISRSDSVWIGTQKGLYLYHTKEKRYKGFFKADGLISDEINDLELVGNQIWIATPRGLMKIPVNYSGENSIPPETQFTHIYIGEKDTAIRTNYDLSWDQNTLTFQFRGLTFKSRKNVSYKYQLEGFDLEPQFLSGQPGMVRYTGVDPGSYRFVVYAINEDGIKSLSPAVVHLTIATPFWKAWWFYVLVSALITWLIFLLFQYRLNVYRREMKLQLDKQQIEQALRSSQLASIRSQMNPHFIFNALNSIQSYIFSDDKRKANELLGKFSDLMRTILKNSEFESITLDEEIRSLRIYLDLENDRFQDRLHFNLMADPAIDPMSVKIPPMLIQPYVENAIKHGLMHKKNDAQLTISMKMESEEVLEVLVDDNGIGRKQSGVISRNNRFSHNQFATRANEKRLELLNFNREKPIGVEIIDKENSRGQSLGTSVRILIPIETMDDHA